MKTQRLTNRQRKEMGLTKQVGCGILRRSSRVIADPRKKANREACRKFRYNGR